MKERLVSVAVVSGNLEAEIIKSFLNSLDIPCLLSNEALGKVYGLGVGPLAEVEVLVPPEHADEAREAMEGYWESAEKNRDEDE